MSCWDILGIERTSDRATIDAAFERQRKFAADSEQESLSQAYGEALAEAGFERSPDRSEPTAAPVRPGAAGDGSELAARDQQIARETVIQVQALLNDSARSKDPQVWKAILREPPADDPAIRAYIGERLQSQVRPLAENGAFPVDVCRFLDDWFGWQTLTRVDPNMHLGGQTDPNQAREASDSNADGRSEPPQMVNFWPAVVGWIVALAILAMIFSNLGGGH